MTLLRVLASRVKALFRTTRSDAELNDEIGAHLDLLMDEHIKRGMSPEDARTAARRAFGAMEPMKETYRDQRSLPFFDTLAQDLRYGARMLLRDRAFTAVAILSLGLGIGASTTVFGVFNSVMLRPLPVADAQRLVHLQPERRGRRFPLFNPIFEELGRRQRSLSGLFAVNDAPFFKVTFDDTTAPSYVRASLVSGTYFSVLGLSPSLGRLFVEHDDDVSGAGSDGCVAVLSHQLWTRRFKQSPDVLGRTLRARSSVCTIVGVAPPGFASHQSGYATEVWLPLRPLTDRKLLESPRMAFFSGVMGRLAPGVSAAAAEADLSAQYQQIVAEQSAANGNQNQAAAGRADFRIRAAPGAQGLDAVRREYSTALSVVVAVVGVVLLIAAVNVANLLLARGAARLPELATRAALGAGRGRLVRQLATEGSMLALLGGAVGAALARVGTPALASLVSLNYTTIALDTPADQRVIGVAVAATLFAALLAGILPGLRLSHSTLQAGMAREGRTTAGGGQRLTRVLVASQLALSLLLVTAAGLLLRTIVHLSSIDPGFRPEHVVVLDVRDETPGASFGAVDSADEKARRALRYRTVEERLNAVPGVRAASVSWLGLFGGNDLTLGLIDADRPDDRAQGHVDYVSARYFETMGMEIVRGRGFSDRDREGTERVAVVNETLVRARFGGATALGRRLALDYTGEQERPFTIVGIVRDSKYNSLRETESQPMMWVPIAQAPFRLTTVALRVDAGAETSTARRAEEVMKATDSQLMLRSTTTLSAQVDQTVARERLLLGFSSGFSALALLLAGVGLYGTLAYAVNRRIREIGVRLAFGAQRAAVLRMVLGDALKLVAIGLAVGTPMALAAGYSLRAFLFGVTPLDPAALVGACVVLTAAALVAAYVPARRAASVDPIVALRGE